MARSLTLAPKLKAPAGLSPARASSARKAPPRGKPAATAKAKLTATHVWHKPLPLVLKPDASLDDAMATVIAACRDHWLSNLAAAVARQPEGTHQVRVGLRRLRSALSVFKKYIPATQRAALNAEAKWLLTQLGPARDLDVFIQSLTAPLASRVSDDAGLAQLIRAARTAQTKAHAAAAKTLQGTRAARFSARLETWLAGHGWRENTAENSNDSRDVRAEAFARRFLNRRLRNIRVDYDDVEKLSVHERHELRIAVKKTRYAVEFFQALLPLKRVKQLATTLKHLQDTLGHLNDIDVAERTVSALVNAGATGAERRQIAAGGAVVSAWHKDAAKAAEPETAKLWRQLKKVPAL